MLCACGSSRHSPYEGAKRVCDGRDQNNGIRWWLVDNKVLDGYSAMSLPSYYQVYALDAGELKRYFSLADHNKSTLFFVPLGSQPNCIQYDITRSDILPDSLKKKYPNLVSLKGKGAGGNDIRLDYDGNVLQGQVISDGEMYYITPLNHNGKIFHMVYKRSDTKEIKQEFERP
ncbi:hypothetical protein [Polluticoccus soli]|uniref:hypothetical protein n=1 Tax=Polluticoccus soli TaxID=3034150 RepID=UPI0023E265E9|nr:hypothetical protein [Flavipsychrobacter sp. JY13-12]